MLPEALRIITRLLTHRGGNYRMNTYDPIESYLRHQPGPTCMISFQLWQQLTGMPLPRSAWIHPAFWANNGSRHKHAQAWLNAGWLVKRGGVDLRAQTVTFVKNPNPPAEDDF
jgi:hypothetical protein